MKIFAPCLLAVGFLASAAAQAGLVDKGATTLDTGSGLEWLDLSATSGYSFAEVSAQFGSGGLFEGYRHATGAEAQGVLAQLGLPIVPYSEYEYGSLTGPLAAFDALLGLNFGGLGPAYGFQAQVGDAVVGYANFRPVFYAFPGSANTAFRLDDVIGASPDWLVSKSEVVVGYAETYKSRTLGHFVVKVTAVPEPSTYALFGVGLGVLAFVARKRRAQA
ncbi:MAG: PEP-CTERM sorting domain-containing protein [Solirubrobacteraceae bacterium]|nr:PEP-CTERM sorting domain-containing protein [Solirubrobacteraceae bacterium]